MNEFEFVLAAPPADYWASAQHVSPVTAEEPVPPEFTPEFTPLGEEELEQLDKLLTPEDEAEIAQLLETFQPLESSDLAGSEAFFSALRNTSIAYRDIAGAGGYTYRQYSDGTIEIRPGSPKNVGKSYPSTSATNVAITKEIGPYSGEETTKAAKKTARGERAAAIGTGIGVAFKEADVLTTLFAMISPAQVTPAVMDEVLETEPAATPAGTPWWLIVGIGAGVLVVGGLIYVISKD